MAFVNTYKAPSDPPSLDEIVQQAFKEPYDINCCIPVPTALENERVALVPFIPSIHAEPFFTAFDRDRAILTRYLPLSFGYTTKEFIAIMESRFGCSESSSILFVIIDKTRPLLDAYPNIRPAGQVAGILGLINISTRNLSMEFAPAIILKDFQGTFISANAIGLLLKFCLDPPSQGGLAYRRTVWCADPLNQKSVAVAEKMGFKKEGILNWYWVLPEGKEGREVNAERLALDAEMGRGRHHGRDTAVLAICWNDWITGTRDLVDEKMKRK